MPAVEDDKTDFQRSNSVSNSAISFGSLWRDENLVFNTLSISVWNSLKPLSEVNGTTAGKGLETHINQNEKKKTQQNNNGKTSKQHKYINKVNSDF